MSITRVAKLAGVSSSTVSRVINNHPRVAPETVQSVRRAMKKLNYTPSDRRPGPKPTNRFRSGTGTANIAFLVFGTSSNRATPAFEELLRGVSGGASANNLNLTFSHVPDIEHLPPNTIDRRIDGVLLHGALPGPEIRKALEGVPAVWLMGNRRRPDWGDQVMPDSYTIGELAADYLVQRGHRQVIFLNLDGDHWPLRLYQQAFLAAAQMAGAQIDSIVLTGPPQGEGYWAAPSPARVEKLVTQYLNRSPRPTGCFVADDMQVAMIQPALQAAGIEIGPGKVELISCNNERPYLIGLNPRPAVIDIRTESIGRRGVEQLLWRLDHRDVSERIVATVEPSIVLPDGAFQARRVASPGNGQA
jgi:LacI family transcriptional regulator